MMKLGMVGLGRMGGNMAERLRRDGHEVVGATTRSGEPRTAPVARRSWCATLEPPRAVWVMVPAGDPTEQTVDELGELLDEGDIIIDGGNSNLTTTSRAARELAGEGHRLRRRRHQRRRVGPARTATASWSAATTRRRSGCEPVFDDARAARTAAPRRPGRRRPLREDDPQRHRVRPDAGLRRGLRAHATQSEYEHRPAAVAGIWSHGSVVRSWLLDLTARALEHDPDLERHQAAYVEDSGEGRWTVHEAIDRGRPRAGDHRRAVRALPLARGRTSRRMVVAALRNQFGGHAVRGRRPASEMDAR